MAGTSAKHEATELLESHEKSIDTLHQNVGIAVGIIDGNGRRYVSYGNFGVNDPRPVGNDTVVEDSDGMTCA